MSVTLINTTRRMKVINLPHATYCEARGSCACQTHGAQRLAAAITLGVLSQQQLDVTDTQRANGDVLRADLVAFYDARGREAIAADVLFGLAGGAAITAVVSLFFPERRRAARAVALVPAPNGLLLEGSF